MTDPGRGQEPHAFRRAIRSARRRLWRNEALRRLAAGLSAGAVVALGTVILAALGWDLGAGTWAMPATLAALGLLWAVEVRVGESEAAIYLDRRLTGDETFASALAGPRGALATAVISRADAAAASAEIRRRVRYRPGAAAKALPVLVVLGVAVHLGGSAADASAGLRLAPGRAAGGAGGVGLAVDGEAGPGSTPANLQAAHDELVDRLEVHGEMRDLLRRLLPGADTDDGAEAAITGESLSEAELAGLRRALEHAASRLPPEDPMRDGVEDVLDAWSEGGGRRAREALEGLAGALRRSSGAADEALREVRRLGRALGLTLGADEAGGPEPGPGAGGALPEAGEAPERALDREDIPVEYRELVRRYFERSGRESR